MDKQKAKVYTLMAQPLVRPDNNGPYGEVHGLSDIAVASLRMAERMVILSGDVVQAADNDEAYESIKRLVEGLHRNLETVAESAKLALQEHGFYRD